MANRWLFPLHIYSEYHIYEALVTSFNISITASQSFPTKWRNGLQTKKIIFFTCTLFVFTLFISKEHRRGDFSFKMRKKTTTRNGPDEQKGDEILRVPVAVLGIEDVFVASLRRLAECGVATRPFTRQDDRPRFSGFLLDFILDFNGLR